MMSSCPFAFAVAKASRNDVFPLALTSSAVVVTVIVAADAAASAARSANNAEITPDHLLAAMLGQDDTVVLPVLTKAGVQPLALRNRVEDALAKLPRAYGGEATM